MRVYVAYLYVEVWKGANGSADAYNEERWIGRRYQKLVERIDQVFFHLHANLLIQKGEDEVVACAEQKHLWLCLLSILKFQSAILQHFTYGRSLLYSLGHGASQGLLTMT